MSDDPPKIWIDQHGLNLGVQGGKSDTLEDVRQEFDDLLEDAVERDPHLGDDVDDDDPQKGVQ